MSADRDVLSDRSGSPAELQEILGKPMTAEDWVESADWWIERGGALPEASPMFKALVDVVQECQRRGAERDRLRAEVEALRELYTEENNERAKAQAENVRLREALTSIRDRPYGGATGPTQKARRALELALTSDEQGAHGG